MKLDLPLHPSRRHPLTGEPLQALWIRPDGRVMWPILGGAPDPDPEPKPDPKPDPEPKPDAKPDDSKNAQDADGKDLGYPKDTPVAEMTDRQAAAYWKHNARKHESRNRDLIGDRTPEQVKKDLEDYAKLQREKQTPSEQAINDAKAEGEKAGATKARLESATTLYRGLLEGAGMKDDELEETLAGINLAAFIGDNGVDTTKLTNHAKRFTSGKEEGGKGRTRDFGGGKRADGQETKGSAGKAEAQRRFNKNKPNQGA